MYFINACTVFFQYYDYLTGYTITHEYACDTELQRLEKKASIVLLSCLIDKSNLRVIEKIGQGKRF